MWLQTSCDLGFEITAGQLPGYNQVAAIEAWLRDTIRFDPYNDDVFLNAADVAVYNQFGPAPVPAEKRASVELGGPPSGTI